MSLPTSQSIQYYTTRDGTTVAIAQKTPASGASASSATSCDEGAVSATSPLGRLARNKSAAMFSTLPFEIFSDRYELLVGPVHAKFM